MTSVLSTGTCFLESFFHVPELLGIPHFYVDKCSVNSIKDLLQCRVWEHYLLIRQLVLRLFLGFYVLLWQHFQSSIMGKSEVIVPEGTIVSCGKYPLKAKCVFVLILRIAYPVVQMATQSGKNVYLTVTKESGNSVVLLFKMISTRAASGLYRAITETHAFYRLVLLLESALIFSSSLNRSWTGFCCFSFCGMGV